MTSFCAGGSQCRSFAYDGLSRLTSESYPEIGNNSHTTNGTTTYTYDTLKAGDLYQRTAPLENQTGTSTVVTTYTFDNLHRPLNVSYNDSTTLAVGWAYDLSSYWGNTLSNGKGRVSYQSTSLAGGTADVIYGYDPMGRVNLYGQCSPENCTASSPNRFIVSYTYNLLGEAKGGSDFMSGGTNWTNTFDAIGRLQSVWTSYLTNSTAGNLISSMTYNALGERTADSLANGLAESWSYDTEGRVTGYSAGSLYNYSGLTYTPNLTASSDSVNSNYSYTYDALGRLATAGNGTNNFSYGYDRWGNRWNQTVTKGSGPSPLYTFNANNQASSFTYDAAGNITNDGVHTYTYDAEGRILTVDSGTTNTYVYNSRGMRAGLMGGENLFDLNGNVVSVVTPGTTTLLYNRYTVGGRLLAANQSNTTTFYHQDWLGGIRAASTLSGSLLGSCTNLPFGDGTSGCGLWYFAGLMYDSWDNLNTSATRSESPTSGRWLTPDPGKVSVMDMTNPQTWNRYAYVTNNPLSYVDPSGLNRAGPGQCSDGNGICPDEGGGADPTSIDNGNGGTDFSAIGNSASDCPICSGPYGAFGTSGIYGGYFGAGQVWGDSTSGGYAASYFQGPEAEDDEDYLDELQELLNNGLEPLDMDNVWRCVGCIYPNQPGPLSGRAANAFRWYIPVTANTPTTYYRYWGPPAQLTGVDGTWYSFFAPEGSQEFFRDQMSLSPQWNSMQNLNEVEIPAGTTVYIGPAAAQGPYSGGGLQVYVPNP